MWTLVMGTILMLLPGAWALRRARDELVRNGRISTPTFLAAFIAHIGHGVCTLVAAFQQTWPMPIHSSVSLGIGLVSLLLGAALIISARLSFWSFQLTWGLTIDRLVTSGVYSICRNPQILGAFLTYVGVAFLGRSIAALILAHFFLLASLIWLPIEEHILESRFGEKYRKYAQRVPRFLVIRRIGRG